MIGQTIDARSSFSFTIAISLLATIALVVWSVWVANPHPLIAAVLPLSIAFCVWRGRPQHVVLLVENDGLQLFGTPEKILYRDIMDVAVGGRLHTGDAYRIPAFPIEIHHASGRLVVPPRMNVNRADFYRFVVTQAPPKTPQPVPSVLAEYVEEQIAKFGAAQVHVVHSRRLLAELWRKRRKAWICAGILVVGLIWAAVGLGALALVPRGDDYIGWLVAGVMACVGAILGLSARSTVARSADMQAIRHPNSCMVIGPAGIAMVQGDMRGSMPWHEITKVSTKMSQWLRTSRVAGLQIRVRGGEVIAFDIYERTPDELASLIRRNLNPAS